MGKINTVDVLGIRESAEPVDAPDNLLAIVFTLLRVKIENLPFPFGEVGLIVENLAVYYGRGDNRAHVEGLLRFALSGRSAEIAEGTDGAITDFDYVRRCFELV